MASAVRTFIVGQSCNSDHGVPIETRKVRGNTRGNPQQSDAYYDVIHDRR